MLEKLKLNPADHPVVNVEAPERAAALERGNIDAFAVWEPWPPRAIPGIRILLNNKAIQIVRTYAYVNRGRAEASRDTTSRLQRALVEATAFIEGNREEAARQVARFLRQDRGLVAELMGKVGHRMDLTAHSVADVRLAIDQLRGMHRLAQEVAPAQAIWQDALRAAAPERVKI